MPALSNQFDEFPYQIGQAFEAGYLCFDIAFEKLSRDVGGWKVMTSNEVQGDCDQNFQVLARVRFDRKFPALYTLKIRNMSGYYEPGQVIIAGSSIRTAHGN